MNTKGLERLIQVMRSNGVTYVKTLEVEIKLDNQPALPVPAPTTTPVVVEQPAPVVPQKQEHTKGPEHAGAVPPVEMAIPHHLNEAARLLKMNDTDLVDALFPLPSGIEG